MNRPLRSFTIARCCLRLLPEIWLHSKQHKSSKFTHSKLLPPTPRPPPLANHQRNFPPLPHHHLSLKTSYTPLSPHPQWHPPARPPPASPRPATVSAQRSTSGEPTCATCCLGDPSLRGTRAHRGTRAQPAARVHSQRSSFNSILQSSSESEKPLTREREQLWPRDGLSFCSSGGV
jgi:hypothetical protein